MIFCETSAIAKFYVAEKESPAMRARLETKDQVCISELVWAELIATGPSILRTAKWSN